MKVRGDFVTNSSSSSFILGFSSEKEIRKELEQEGLFSSCRGYGRDEEDDDFNPLERVYADCIEAEVMTIDQVLDRARDALEYEVMYDVEEDMYPNYRDRYAHRGEPEFVEACEKEMERRLKEIRKNTEQVRPKQTVFVEVTYSDHSREGSELEHDIVPYLKCCVQRFSWH